MSEAGRRARQARIAAMAPAHRDLRLLLAERALESIGRLTTDPLARNLAIAALADDRDHELRLRGVAAVARSAPRHVYGARVTDRATSPPAKAGKPRDLVNDRGSC